MSAPAARASVPASATASSERAESSTPTMMVDMAGTLGAPGRPRIGPLPRAAAEDHGRGTPRPPSVAAVSTPRWHSSSRTEVLARLDSGAGGLTNEQAGERLASGGPNRLPE